MYWLNICFEENQLQLWMLNCLNEDQFNDLVIKKYKQKSKIELQEKIINQIIAKNAEWAHLYAYYILQGPFPAGEPAIATNEYYAFWYAYDILRRPFPAGEPAIAKTANWSYLYAFWVLNGPFPAGEPIIAKSAYWKKKYEKLFNVKL